MSKLTEATHWMKGFLAYEPRALSEIIHFSPYNQKTTIMALGIVAHHDKGKYTLSMAGVNRFKTPPISET